MGTECTAVGRAGQLYGIHGHRRPYVFHVYLCTGGCLPTITYLFLLHNDTSCTQVFAGGASGPCRHWASHSHYVRDEGVRYDLQRQSTRSPSAPLPRNNLILSVSVPVLVGATHKCTFWMPVQQAPSTYLDRYQPAAGILAGVYTCTRR